MMANYLTTKDLARQLGVSRITVFNRIKKGQIPAERIGRSYAIKEDVAERLIRIHNAPMDEAWIDRGVERVVAQYGDVLKWLSKE